MHYYMVLLLYYIILSVPQLFSTCQLSLFFFFGSSFVSADKFIEKHGSIIVLTMNNQRQFNNHYGCFNGRAGVNPRVHGHANKPMQMKGMQGIRALCRALYIFVSRQSITMETTGRPQTSIQMSTCERLCNQSSSNRTKSLHMICV